MRDIKFRVWESQDETMIYLKEDDNGAFLCLPMWCGTVLMQFTGLKDENGKDIYEGDIVISEDYKKRHGIVVFGKYKQADMSSKYECGNLGYYIDFKDEWIRKDMFFWHGLGLEVIGNIYENPELLKE